MAQEESQQHPDGSDGSEGEETRLPVGSDGSKGEEDFRGLSRVASGNPVFPLLVPVTSGSF